MHARGRFRPGKRLPVFSRFFVQRFYVRGHPLAKAKFHAALNQVNLGKTKVDVFITSTLEYLLEANVFTVQKATEVASNYGKNAGVVTLGAQEC